MLNSGHTPKAKSNKRTMLSSISNRQFQNRTIFAPVVNEPFSMSTLGKIDIRHADADVVEYPGLELRYIAERPNVLEFTQGDKRQQPGTALGGESHKPGTGCTD